MDDVNIINLEPLRKKPDNFNAETHFPEDLTTAIRLLIKRLRESKPLETSAT